GLPWPDAGFSCRHRLVDVQGEEQPPVQLVGTADEPAHLGAERARRGLEVGLVDLDDVADLVDEQAEVIAADLDDDHHRLDALGQRRQAEAHAQVDGQDDLAAEVHQARHGRAREGDRRPRQVAQRLLDARHVDAVRRPVDDEGGQLLGHDTPTSASSSSSKKCGSASATTVCTSSSSVTRSLSTVDPTSAWPPWSLERVPSSSTMSTMSSTAMATLRSPRVATTTVSSSPSATDDVPSTRGRRTSGVIAPRYWTTSRPPTTSTTSAGIFSIRVTAASGMPTRRPSP